MIKTAHIFLPQVNDTRVCLHSTDPNDVGSDYINANFVKVSRVRGRRLSEGTNKYISLVLPIGRHRPLFGAAGPPNFDRVFFVEHHGRVHQSEGLHCHSGMSHNDRQRFLADDMAGKHEGDRHDNEGSGERAGQ